MRALPQCKVDEVRALIASGKSARQAAIEAGISRSSARKIANGTYVVKHNPIAMPRCRPATCAPRWCPLCRATIILWPCVACTARKERHEC
jgi:hypothetical protein